jgi:Transposase DDE domain
MPRKKPDKEDLRTRLAELSGWNTATRDDAYTAKALHETRSMDQIHGLNEAVFFDEFFFFLKEIGVWSFLENLDPKERKGELYPFIKFVLATIMRCVGGVQSMLAMEDLLLTDPAIMGLLGFNGAQVQQGSCDRGLGLRKKPVKIRGAFSYETIADNIVKIGPDKLSEMFNGAIRCLAKHGFFSKDVDLIIDATDDEATPNYKTDNGNEVPHVTKEKRPDVRANGHAKKIKTTVYGWKMWIAFEPISGLPVAMTFDGINIADNTHAYQVLDQACKNLEGYSTVHSVAFDRGFLDGKLLWKVENEIGAIVYIPTKSNMDITAEARGIARRAEALALQGKKQDGVAYKERIEKIKRGSGKSAWVEERKTTVVRIRDLPCDWWTAEGSSSKANAKSFVPKLVNATVVLRWDGAPKDEEKEVVILDTDPSKDPFAGFDAYDERSRIENTINREAKESWFLENHPKRSEAGVRVHAYFVLVCMALTTAFRKYLKDAEETVVSKT